MRAKKKHDFVHTEVLVARNLMLQVAGDPNKTRFTKKKTGSDFVRTEVLLAGNVMRPVAGAQFTCFTSTKVQNTDAERAH